MTNNFLASTPGDLQKALNEVNRKMQEEETQAQAKTLGLPYIDLQGFPVDLSVLGMFTGSEARLMGAVPFYKDVRDLRIGVVHPHHPLLAEKIKSLSLKNKISLYLISPSSLESVLKFYEKIVQPRAVHEDIIRIKQESDFSLGLKQLASSEQQPKNATEILETIFGTAMFFKASDIHLEPEDHFIKLRYRLDGVLQDMAHISKISQKPIIGRIKILSKLKLNVEHVPQDGRMTFYYLGQPVDVRISILPSAYGEELVMRLLGTTAANLKLKDLGLRPETLDKVHSALAKPNGMIITTGPTGSGKTTSLYAFLNELNEPGVKIITLEDPVEYKLEGIVQTPIDHSVNFDFAVGLRSILRQDPDIVMVGEIRDQETADTACQAALTGHLVLSTLHTNDAAGAVPRLMNMGVKPFVLGPALTCVIAQRLVRKICEYCKQETSVEPALLKKIELYLSQIPQASGVQVPAKIVLYHGVGCARCNNLGYQGRMGIYEVFEITEAAQDLIMKQATMSDFRKLGQQQGMVTMLQDGLLKALDGITDVEEVFRVAGEA